VVEVKLGKFMSMEGNMKYDCVVVSAMTKDYAGICHMTKTMSQG
jgi:hypothetical protein